MLTSSSQPISTGKPWSGRDIGKKERESHGAWIKVEGTLSGVAETPGRGRKFKRQQFNELE